MPEDYFKETEHAVRHLFAGLDSCWSYYERALDRWDVSQVSLPLTPNGRAALEKYLELAGAYFDLKFSEATFAGSILQVAYMAIRLFSRNNVIPPSCSTLVRPSNNSAIPFCVGRECHGVPVG